MNMHVIIASVTVTVPKGMSPEQVVQELKASVAFGSAQVSILHVSDVNIVTLDRNDSLLSVDHPVRPDKPSLAVATPA
jgi:hypothetical protein